jgi:hypothetical protein
MNSLLDRLAALDAARLVAVSGACLLIVLEAAWVYAAVTGPWTYYQLGAALAAAAIGVVGLLYPFRLGTPSASI